MRGDGRVADRAAAGHAAYLFDVAPPKTSPRSAPMRCPRATGDVCSPIDTVPASSKVDYALSAPIPWDSPVCREAAPFTSGNAGGSRGVGTPGVGRSPRRQAVRHCHAALGAGRDARAARKACRLGVLPRPARIERGSAGGDRRSDREVRPRVSATASWPRTRWAAPSSSPTTRTTSAGTSSEASPDWRQLFTRPVLRVGSLHDAQRPRVHSAPRPLRRGRCSRDVRLLGRRIGLTPAPRAVRPGPRCKTRARSSNCWYPPPWMGWRWRFSMCATRFRPPLEDGTGVASRMLIVSVSSACAAW